MRSSNSRPLAAAAGALLVLRACAGMSAEVTLTAREFAFEPETVTVEHGERVTLVLENMGVLAHNVTIPALSQATATVQSDGRATLEFAAPGAGIYEIVCSVPGHAEAGMRATLQVR